MIEFYEMRKLAWIAIFLILQGGIGLKSFDSKDEKIDLSELLPLEVNGWEAKEKDKVYDPETIFDYIDGAGEVYRSYNFKELRVRRYSKENQPDIIADLFDMGSSRDAFGVFTHDLEGEDSGVGQGSTYKGGLLSFWKDRYFVSLYSEEETEESKEALIALGKYVDASIKNEGKLPEIVTLMPSENLVKKGIHYFHNYIILNYHFFVSSENILLLNQQTEAALGIYGTKDQRSYVLIVRYPEVERASQAYKNFMKIYMPDADKTGVVQTEDSKWTSSELSQDLLIIIFNMASVSGIKEMREKINQKLEHKK